MAEYIEFILHVNGFHRHEIVQFYRQILRKLLDQKGENVGGGFKKKNLDVFLCWSVTVDIQSFSHCQRCMSLTYIQGITSITQWENGITHIVSN
jgi:hypothetical protein